MKNKKKHTTEQTDEDLAAMLGRMYVEGASPIVGRRVREALHNITGDTLGVLKAVVRSPEGQELGRRARALDDAAGGVVQKGVAAFLQAMRGGRS
jgi:hypothetical protein